MIEYRQPGTQIAEVNVYLSTNRFGYEIYHEEFFTGDENDFFRCESIRCGAHWDTLDLLKYDVFMVDGMLESGHG